MTTLVFLEHHFSEQGGGELQKGALGVLAKAQALGGEVSAVVLGSGVEGLAAGAGRFGATTVYVVDDPKLEAPLPQPRVDAIAQLVRERGFETVLFALEIDRVDAAIWDEGPPHRQTWRAPNG